jgi:ECF sigma factor
VNGSSHDVTALLHAWNAGDVTARDRLVALVYADLRRRAAAQLRCERPGVDRARAHGMAKRSGQWARVTLDERLKAAQEAGEALGISIATAERDWQAARAWLLKELRGERRHDA